MRWMPLYGFLLAVFARLSLLICTAIDWSVSRVGVRKSAAKVFCGCFPLSEVTAKLFAYIVYQGLAEVASPCIVLPTPFDTRSWPPFATHQYALPDVSADTVWFRVPELPKVYVQGRETFTAAVAADTERRGVNM